MDRKKSFDNLRKKAEAVFKQQLTDKSLAGADNEKLLEELQMHQIELSMQNEALREIQFQLQKSHDRFAVLFEQAPVGYLVLDSKGMIHEANNMVSEMLNRDRAGIIGRSFNTFIHRDDRNIYLARFRAFFNSPEGKTLELRLTGTVRSTVLVQLSAVRTKSLNMEEEGEDGGYLLVNITDITERKQTEEKRFAAEKALQLQNLILKTQNEVSLDGILVVDHNDEIISFNHRFADIWGIPEDVLAMQSGEQALNYVLPKLADPGRFVDRINDLYKNREEKSHEEIDLIDGRVLDRYSAPMLDRDGRYYGRVWYYRDITERKKAEASIEKSLEEKKILLSEIHHRVKNNMAVISSMLSLQFEFGDQHKDPEKLLKDLQTRILSMAWVHELVYESKNFSEISSDKLLQRLADYLKRSYEPAGKEITVQVRTEGVMLEMNSSVPLTLIIAEVLINAWKHAFTGRRTGRIEVTLRRIEEGYILTVQDNGVGVADTEKLNSPNSFGYTIIHGLARQLRGGLVFSTPPDGGFRVEVRFPEQE